MHCSIHPQTEAAGMCTYCGKPFCSDCLIEVKGKLYCKNDLGNVIDEAKNAGANTGTPVININNANSNTNTNMNINQNTGYGIGVPPKNKMVALLLCVFLGYLGAHRFYVGKTGTGIIWLFTFGLMGVGWLIDILLIVIGSFRDNFGRPLV